MGIERASFEELTGYVGIGALELLAAFFIIDGFSNFFELVEWYSKTNSWAILFTVPGVVVAYVLGAITAFTAESLLPGTSLLTANVFAQVVASKNEPLLRRHSETERISRVLSGASIAFVLLALGLLSEVRMLGRFGFVGYWGFAAAVTIGVLCPIVARNQQRRFLQHAQAVFELPTDAQPRLPAEPRSAGR